LSISNTNVKIWVNVIPTHSIVIIHCINQQIKYSHHILKCVDIALPSSKNALPCYENEFIRNIWINNPMLHYLYQLNEIFTMRTIKKDNTYTKMANPSLERLWHVQYLHISQQKIILSHVICEIPCNMRKLAH